MIIVRIGMHVLTACIISLDIDVIVECDDEYWLDADGQPLFEQPPGLPCKVSVYNYVLRLHRILAYASRTVVSAYRYFLHEPEVQVAGISIRLIGRRCYSHTTSMTGSHAT